MYVKYYPYICFRQLLRLYNAHAIPFEEPHVTAKVKRIPRAPKSGLKRNAAWTATREASYAHIDLSRRQTLLTCARRRHTSAMDSLPAAAAAAASDPGPARGRPAEG